MRIGSARKMSLPPIRAQCMANRTSRIGGAGPPIGGFTAAESDLPGEGGGKPVISQTFEPPGVRGQVGKAEDSRIHPADHGRRNLEARRVEGEARTERLDQRFLHCPEPVEEPDLGASAGCRDRRAFLHAEYPFGNCVEIPALAANFHVDSKTSLRSERDQSVRCAVAHVEADRRCAARHESERFAVFQGAEREQVVRAAEQTAEIGPERGTAEGKLATRPLDLEPPAAFDLGLVEPCNGPRLAVGFRSQIDVEDTDAADDTERAPPWAISRCHCRHVRAPESLLWR